MKRYYFSLMIFIIILNINVLAKEKNISIEEELIPITNNSKLVGVKYIVTIPKSYDENNIVIEPKIFDYINNYKHLIPGEDINIEFQINNKSSNNYLYKNNSFILSTNNINEDYKNLEPIGIGFDNKTIYNNFQVYRTYNEAIMYLYDQDEFIDDYLSDDSIDYKLKCYGYKGIEELDEFYLDYYNDKFNIKEKSLGDYDYNIKQEIFSGKISNNKETNSKINELAYNYFYNKLLYYKFKNDYYTIGTYINKNIGNKYLKDLIIFKDNSYSITNMKLGLNKNYYSEIFDDYGLYLKMIFELEKNNSYIKPPNTGI